MWLKTPANQSAHPQEIELNECVCFEVEPVGPRHRVAVHHGNHSGGNRPERFPTHQPHHHTNHASPEDNKRFTHTEMQSHTQTHGDDVGLMLNHCRVPVLKLLKMATGMRALLDTVIQALPQVRRSTEAKTL